MTRDEIDALVARAMATRCGGCDDVDHRMQDALCAEIERLRALPVIATCGECRWCHPSEVCTHPRAHVELEIDGCTMPPPSWCPLRGGAR